MKNWKRMIISTILALGMTVGCCACNKTSNGKTIVKIVNYEGGYGVDWLFEAEKRFEAEHLDIELDIDTTKTPNATTMNSSASDLYFGGQGDNPRMFAQKGWLASIDDIVTEKYDTRDGKKISIADKIDESYQTILKGADGKFYGLPYPEYYGGLSYDVDFFDKHNLYVADPVENGTNTTDDVSAWEAFGITTNFIAHKDAKKSCGADGKYGTFDAGMPTSLTEFLVLCDKIKNDVGATPLTMSGSSYSYIALLINGLEASLSGYEEMRASYDFEGSVTYVDGYTDEALFEGVDYISKPKTAQAEIDCKTNGYLTTQTVSRYYTDALIEIAYKEGWFSKDFSKSTVSNLDAQGNFIASGLNGIEQTAMLIEGSYWFTEALENNKMEDYKKLSGGKTERNVKWMPLPVTIDKPIMKAEDAMERVLMSSSIRCFAFINARTEKKPAVLKACKEFLKFLYSDVELAKYTANSGIIKASMTYPISDDDLKGLSIFQKSVLEVQRNSKVISSVSDNETFLSNYTDFAASSSNIKNMPMIKSGVNNIHYPTVTKALNAGYGTKTIFESTMITKDNWAKYYKG